MTDNPLDQNNNEDEESKGMRMIFQDLSPGFKVFFLMVFAMVSGMMFDLLGSSIVNAVYGINAADIDLTKITKEEFKSYREAMQIMSLLHQIGMYLLPPLTFFQMAEKTGVKFIKYEKVNSPKTLGLIVLLGVSTLFGGLYIQALNLEIVSWFDSLQSAVDQINEGYHTAQAVVLSGGTVPMLINIALIGILVPMCEEFFFRGAMQQYIVQMSRKVWSGILLTSVVFAILHMEFDGFLVRFSMAVLLGFVFHYSGSIWASVILHASYNTTGVILEYMDVNGQLDGQDWLIKIMPAIGMLIAGIVIYLLFRKRALTLSA